MTDINQPLFGKYVVYRTDGKDKPEGTKEDARYFVLDYVHDPFARKALAAYVDELLTAANSGRREYNMGGRSVEDRPFSIVPQLASDLMHELLDTESPDHERKAKELVDTWIGKDHIEDVAAHQAKPEGES